MRGIVESRAGLDTWKTEDQGHVVSSQLLTQEGLPQGIKLDASCEVQKPANSISKKIVGKRQKKGVQGQRLRPMIVEVGVLNQPLDQDRPVGDPCLNSNSS